ncbi:pyruvate synthase subunit beta [Candidatus Woesearchaeota archaeon]|nr:pyruvate synthase subunit beta [Candidatus Woesearchaeota archaeon]
MADEIFGFPPQENFMKGHRACAGCGEAIALRHILKAVDDNTIIVGGTGCSEVVSSPYPYTSWKLPWIHAAFETVAPVASGVARALKAQGKDTKVIGIGGDGSLFDIGFGALSGAAERGEDFAIVCLDNEAYMNTGIQRSGATPKFASTTTSPAGKLIHGKQEFKKPLPFILAMHGCYVATANPAFLTDLIAKVKKAVDFPGVGYVQVYTPCVPGWKYSPEMTIEICKLAVNTNVYPLYEIENGKLKITKEVAEPKPVKEYLKTQGRFKHLSEEEISKVQEHVNKEWDRLKRYQDTGIEF